MHPVIALIRARREAGSTPGARADGARLALIIEGGGMRGAISGGMVLGLEELGLRDTFDAVYGASAGALNGAWFAGGAAARGLPAWADPELRVAAIRLGNPLRGKPVVDGHHLTEVIYETQTPMPFDDVINSPVPLHPVATDVLSGEATDLGPYIVDKATLKLALRASTALPILSGRPVRLADRRFIDAGVADAIPYRVAVDQGASHLLVLRSRRDGEQETADSGHTARLVAAYLRRYSAALAATYLQRPQRLLEIDRGLAELEGAGAGAGPAAVSIRPAASTAPISRLERDHTVVLAGIEAGRSAVRAALG